MHLYFLVLTRKPRKVSQNGITINMDKPIILYHFPIFHTMWNISHSNHQSTEKFQRQGKAKGKKKRKVRIRFEKRMKVGLASKIPFNLLSNYFSQRKRLLSTNSNLPLKKHEKIVSTRK